MKKICALLMIVVLLVSCAGCNSSDKKGDKVVLKIGVPNGDDLTPMEIIDGFKKENPDIEVVLDETPWSDFKTKLKMQISAGNAPDVFLTDSGYAASLGGMGAAVDLSDKIKNDLNRDDYTSALDVIQDGTGKTWGVTHSLAASAVVYNKAIFDKYGVEYPEEDWTFEDMLDIAKKLTKDTDGDGKTDIYGLANGENITTGWLPFILAKGGAPLDETRTKSMFNDPKTLEGLETYRATVNDLKITPDRTWVTANGNTTTAFYTGKVAMLVCLMGTTSAINDNAPKGFEYDAQMMPVGWTGERHCIYVPNQWVIYSKAKKPQQEAAWKFIKYYLSEKSQNAVAESFSTIGIPVRKSALEAIDKIETIPANKAAFYKGLDKHGISLFECPSWEEWKPKAEQAIMEMQSGAITAKEASDRIHKEVKSLLSK